MSPQRGTNDFSTFATDFANPTHYIGPNALDRTHQISFGGYMDLPAGFQIGFASHFDSPLPSNVTLPVSGAPGGIFQTDVAGDGEGDGGAAIEVWATFFLEPMLEGSGAALASAGLTS